MKRLRSRLIILVLMAVMPALGAIAYYGYQEQTGAYARARAQAAELAHLAATHLGDSTRQANDLVSTLAAVPAVLAGTRSACHAFTRKILAQNAGLANIGVIDRKGYLACSARSTSGRVYLGDRPYFRQALDNHGPVTSSFQVGRVVSVPMIVFATSLPAGARGGRSVIYASLRLDQLSRLAEASWLPEGSTMSLLDASRQIIAHYPQPNKWLGKHVPILTDLTRGLGAGATAVKFGDGPEGGKRLFAVYAARGANGKPEAYAVVAIPRSRIVLPAHTAMATSFTMLGIVTLMLMSIAWWGGHRLILRRVDVLVDAAARLGRGQWGARAEVEGHDELARLGTAFDTMAEALEGQHANLEHEVERSSRLNRIYRVLSGINGVILRVRDRDKLLAEACRIAVELGGHPMAWIGLLDEASGEVHMAASAGANSEMIRGQYITADGEAPEGQGTVGTALRTGKPVVCNDVAGDPRMAAWRGELVGNRCLAVATFPLMVEDRVIGNFTVCSDQPGYFDEDEMQLFEEVAADTAIGLELIDTGKQRDYLAHFDPATGLPNGRRFLDMLEQTLRMLPADSPRLCILAVEFPELRKIADHFGFRVADEIRRKVALLMMPLLEPQDTLAVLDPQMFGVAALANEQGRCEPEVLARQILALSPFEIEVEGHYHLLAARIGVAPGDTDLSAEARMRNAEVAAHSIAPGSKGGYRLYSPQNDVRETRRYRLRQGLRRAIEREEFELVYQPYVDALNERYVGAEVLLRWTSRELGPVSPGEFIPIAEQDGFITEIGPWVFHNVLRQIEAWQAAGLAPLAISVNASAAEFQQPDLVQSVEHCLAASGADIGRCVLALELTETAVVQDFEHVSAVLQQLRALGLRTYLDDYGTGYSSLLYLQRTPLDVLKIDLSFIRHIVEDPTSRALTRSSISLAHSLDLKTIAEGVESREQLDILRELGCDFVQGFLFSRPLPAAEAAEFMARYGG